MVEMPFTLAPSSAEVVRAEARREPPAVAVAEGARQCILPRILFALKLPTDAQLGYVIWCCTPGQLQVMHWV